MDSAADPLGVRIMDAVAEHADVPTTELPPLYEVLDPEALDELFSHSTDRPLAVPSQVSFTYADYRVTVFADREIKVTDTAAVATAPAGTPADPD